MAILRVENIKLRRIVAEKIPTHAQRILQECTSEISELLHESDGEQTRKEVISGNGSYEKSYLDLSGIVFNTN
jgi:hypothetical protein